MKQRFGFVERQLGRIASVRTGEVADDRDDRGDALAVRTVGCFAKRAAPGASPLAVARIEVEIEDSQMGIVFVEHFVGGTLLVIYRNRNRAEGQPPQPVAKLKNARSDIVQREVEVERRLVEVILRFADFFGIIPPVPCGERAVLRLLRLDRAQGLQLPFRRIEGGFPEFVEQVVHPFGSFRHPVVQHEGGVGRVVHQAGFLGAEPDDVVDDLPVVELVAVVAALYVAGVQLFAQSPVFGIGQERDHAGRTERENPFVGHSHLFGLVRRRVGDGLGNPADVFRTFDDEGKVPRLGQQVVAESDAQQRQFPVDVAQPLLLPRVELCSGSYELFIGLFGQADLFGRQRHSPDLFVHGADFFE